MSTKNIIMSMTFLSLILPSGVSGDPILLASYEYHLEGGGARSFPGVDKWDVAIIMQLGFYDWEPYPSIRALGGDVRWADGQSGSVLFTSENDAEFDIFAEYATNGIEDQIRFWDLTPVGGNGSPYQPESIVIKGLPDLIGYQLTAVQLTVQELSFTPWNPFPGEEGMLYSGDITWDFYGISVPEPLTMASIAIALLICVYAVSRFPSRHHDLRDSPPTNEGARKDSRPGGCEKGFSHQQRKGCVHQQLPHR